MTRRSLFCLLAALAVLPALPACAHVPPPLGPVVTLEVYDRADRTTLPVYEKDGRRYIVGTPAHEYTLRVRNLTGRRVLAVTSVDGVNVVTGETASPAQSGYVLDPWGSVEITGWRKSLSRTAAFYFTSLPDSYAARTGRPLDVGVIGVAAFPERVAAPVRPDGWLSQAPSPSAQSKAEMPAAAPAEAGEARETAKRRMADSAEATQPSVGAAAPAPRIGTGHGREQTSVVQHVRFERESDVPAQTLVVQYDRRENLVALGVLPPPSLARHEPNAFPNARFVPDPPR